MKTPNLEGCDSTSNDTAIRTGNSSEPLCSKTVPFLPKSESSVTLVKSFPIDPQTLPVVSNTSSVANLPCATSFGAGGGASVVPPVPVVTSLYSNTPLVFPSEGSSLANAMYSANLAAGMPAVGAAQAPLATVFSSNSLVSSNSIWQPPDVSFLGSVDQSNLLNSGGVFPSVNPLVDLHNAVGVDKLLSKEEFYRVKRQLMEESSHRSFHRASRTRRSHSRDSQPSRRSGIESRRRAAPDYYSRKRDDDRRSRKRSPPRHRLRSRSSESDHRQTSTKGESLFVEDYDTWRRKKARRQQMEAVAGECRRRLSPFRGTRRRSDSLLSSPLRGDKREASPRGTHVERYRRYAEESDKSRLRSPFPSGSPGRNSLETTSPCCGSNRHQERRCRHEGSDVSRIKSSSKLPSKLSENIIPSVPDPSNEVDLEGLDAKALKKIRKQQKKAKREKKLARRAARAQKSAGLSGGSDKGIYDDLDGISPVMFGDEDNDGEAVANVKREKKKKRKHKFVRRVDSEADSDGDSRRKSKRKRKEKKSKRYHDNVEQRVVGEDMEESLEVC
uniref:Protein kinase domain-containing protein n=1 Tax=Mesocestoides corti TaxID=53468 RepID=A0A5K3FEC1_MESCO